MVRTAQKQPLVKQDRLAELGLSRLFTAGSGARVVAELLLTGETMTRKHLADTAGVAGSAVSRVVQRLQENGVEIVREEPDQHSGNRTAFFTAKVPTPEELTASDAGSAELAAIGPRVVVRFVGMETGEHGATVRLDSSLGQVTGHAVSLGQIGLLSTTGLPLCRVILRPGGAQDWVLGDGTDGEPPTTVTDITYV